MYPARSLVNERGEAELMMHGFDVTVVAALGTLQTSCPVDRPQHNLFLYYAYQQISQKTHSIYDISQIGSFNKSFLDTEINSQKIHEYLLCDDPRHTSYPLWTPIKTILINLADSSLQNFKV